MRIRRLIGLVLAVVVALPAARVSAGTDTTTQGRICRNEPCHIETFSGGYIFKGTTRPSEQGQIVKFEYKRVGGEKWHLFGKPESENKCFISVDGTPRDRINANHRWREHFDINGFTCAPKRRWFLRAKFIRQDGLGRSVEWVRIRAAYGD